jgi:hypothetical protein
MFMRVSAIATVRRANTAISMCHYVQHNSSQVLQRLPQAVQLCLPRSGLPLQLQAVLLLLLLLLLLQMPQQALQQLLQAVQVVLLVLAALAVALSLQQPLLVLTVVRLLAVAVA